MNVIHFIETQFNPLVDAMTDVVAKLSRGQTILWVVFLILLLGSTFSITHLSQQIVIINERLSDLERIDKTVHILVERWYDEDAQKYGYKFIDVKEEKK